MSGSLCKPGSRRGVGFLTVWVTLNDSGAEESMSPCSYAWTAFAMRLGVQEVKWAVRVIVGFGVLTVTLVHNNRNKV